MTSTTFDSEDFGQWHFAFAVTRMKRKACDWTVSYRVPLRETRSTRAPTVRLEVVAACGFDPRRDDHLGSTFVRDFMSPLTNKGETRRPGPNRSQNPKWQARVASSIAEQEARDRTLRFHIWRWRKRKTRPGVMTGLEGVANPGGHAKKRKGLRDFLRGQGGRYRGRRESPRFGSGDFGAQRISPLPRSKRAWSPVAGPRIVPFRSVRLGVMEAR